MHWLSVDVQHVEQPGSVGLRQPDTALGSTLDPPSPALEGFSLLPLSPWFAPVRPLPLSASVALVGAVPPLALVPVDRPAPLVRLFSGPRATLSDTRPHAEQRSNEPPARKLPQSFMTGRG
jgi:hypothetical protein